MATLNTSDMARRLKGVAIENALRGKINNSRDGHPLRIISRKAISYGDICADGGHICNHKQLSLNSH